MGDRPFGGLNGTNTESVRKAALAAAAAAGGPDSVMLESLFGFGRSSNQTAGISRFQLYMAAYQEGESRKRKAEEEAAQLEASTMKLKFSRPAIEAVRNGVVPHPEPEPEPETEPESLPDFEDYTHLVLKVDHATRPVWVTPQCRIFLETFSSIYKLAYDFLITISEPVSRPPLIHEYSLTAESLLASVSVGLDTQTIITILNRLCKTELPEEVVEYITLCTSTYGKAKIVLRKNSYYIESPLREVLQELLQDEVIRLAWVPPSVSAAAATTHVGVNDGPTGRIMEAFGVHNVEENSFSHRLITGIKGGLGRTRGTGIGEEIVDDEDDEGDAGGSGGGEASREHYSFQIDTSRVEYVTKQCLDLGFPLLEEYDFRNDSSIPNLEIELKPTTQIREYQAKSLSKMFSNGRARSGVIVLPCGAGKTLVGVTATCTIRKSTLVLCTGNVSVEQWKQQYKIWSTIDDSHICRFTSGSRDPFPEDEACIAITTYPMLTFGGERAEETKKIMQAIESRDWGLIVFDEVHVVPAKMFRKVIGLIRAHSKLGLTATLVREDEKTTELNWLIGPKLYEANWMDLTRQGFIARVQCAEVWCPMTPNFYRWYLTEPPAKQKLLVAMNPNKFQACEFLIRFHEARGDKILVFSDYIKPQVELARKLGRYYVNGKLTNQEQLVIFEEFRRDPSVQTIFISKVGDTSIDLPDANVLIQISSQFGSRRQEAQRLGRILRPKSRREGEGEYDAFFYSLVSCDTHEMYFSGKRQRFLIEQGYTYKVITQLPDLSNQGLCYNTADEQNELLEDVLRSAAEDTNEEAVFDSDDVRSIHRATSARRITGGSMDALSGGLESSAPGAAAAALANTPLARRTMKERLARTRVSDSTRLLKQALGRPRLNP